MLLHEITFQVARGYLLLQKSYTLPVLNPEQRIPSNEAIKHLPLE